VKKIIFVSSTLTIVIRADGRYLTKMIGLNLVFYNTIPRVNIWQKKPFGKQHKRIKESFNLLVFFTV
jgi:hypothetical protein